MRTTIDLPDETFRQLKARAALSGLKLKDLVTQFIERGLVEHQALTVPVDPVTTGTAGLAPTRFDNAPWLKVTRRQVKPGMSHDMDEIRTALAQGWLAETSEKCRVSDSDE